MEHNLAALTKAINAVDPGKLQRMYPTKDQSDRYLSLKSEAIDLLRKVVPGGLPDECENKLENLTKRLIDLANEVAPGTELGGRLLLNHMVVWAETHNLERAIYLAGQCEGLQVREPYRTQIKLQPANACMTRYRQIFKVVEWIRKNIQAELGGEIGQMLSGMLKALLNQFEFFAVEARRKNDRHVYATYMEALAYLFRAHECSAAGEDKKADNYSKMVTDLVESINEPNSNSLRVQLQYHVKNHEEFWHFRRLYDQHGNIASRLKRLAEKAQPLLDLNAGIDPPCHFWFSSYVGGGARVASVAGLICAVAGALGIGPQEAQVAIDTTWQIALDSMNLASNIIAAPDQVAMHTGGLVIHANLEELRTLMHTGGLV